MTVGVEMKGVEKIWNDDYWTEQKYTIVVDYGKPYDIKVESKSDLKSELKKLKKIYEEGDHPFFDILVYNKFGIDVTNQIFSEMGGEI